ncbi:MAG: 50S ribosomal protein L13 [Limisphaerales bacterium]
MKLDFANQIHRNHLLTSIVHLINFASPLLGFEMKTHLPKVNLDQRKWHVIDADGAVLGRLAVQVSDILRGKNKPVYTPHPRRGRLRGRHQRREGQAHRQKGAGQGIYELFRLERRREIRHRRAGSRQAARILITHAVKGMIPKNRLGSQLLTKLKVFKGDKHPHAAQMPAVLTPVK